MIDGAQIAQIAVHLQRHAGLASKRTQIGRLYYAAFIDARHYCKTRHGFVPTGRSKDHEEVRRIIRDQCVDPGIARRLGTLRYLRNLADYRDHIQSQHLDGHLTDARKLASDISERLHDVGGRRFYPPSF